MKAFCLCIFSIGFLCSIFSNIDAMSKPYQTYASVILINNRPCVYVVGSNRREFTQGINLYEGERIIWKNTTIPFTASKSSCVVLGDPSYVFKTNTIYSVELGGPYAYAAFCLMRDSMNHLFLSKVGGDGSYYCTTDPRQNSEDKSRWQRFKEWW